SYGERSFNVSYGVCERERDFLNCRRACFAYVIAADGNRVPVRNFSRAETERVRHQSKRRRWRIDVRAARYVLFQNIVLKRAVYFVERHTLFFRNRKIEREQHRRSRVDGHRSRNRVEGNSVEETQHVFYG